jgi:hypothetical protein
VKNRIQRHIDSSLTSMVDALEKLSKGAAYVAHKLVLLQKRIAELEAANEAATRRKSRKRKRIQQGGTLTAEEGLQLTTLMESAARGGRKRRAGDEADDPAQRRRGRCGRCGETGHNSRTCKQEAAVDSE